MLLSQGSVRSRGLHPGLTSCAPFGSFLVQPLMSSRLLKQPRQHFTGFAFDDLVEGLGVERRLGADVDRLRSALPRAMDEACTGKNVARVPAQISRCHP